MQRLRALIFEAAAAASEGDFLRATRVQTSARDVADELCLAKEGMVLEHMLGAYVMQAGQPQRAVAVFESAFQRAAVLEAGDHMVQCKLSIAAAHVARRDTEAAVVCYAEAGTLGAERGAAAFSIEAFRMAGQLLAGLRRDQEAAEMWQRALAVAEVGDKLEISMSSAADVARQLAKACRSRGLLAQAASLDEQALVLETPPDLPEAAAEAKLGVPAATPQASQGQGGE
jgi:tetratricopeptide (TPR) repeat protein